MFSAPLVFTVLVYKWVLSSAVDVGVSLYFLQGEAGVEVSQVQSTQPAEIINMLPQLTILWTG